MVGEFLEPSRLVWVLQVSWTRLLSIGRSGPSGSASCLVQSKASPRSHRDTEQQPSAQSQGACAFECGVPHLSFMCKDCRNIHFSHSWKVMRSLHEGENKDKYYTGLWRHRQLWRPSILLCEDIGHLLTTTPLCKVWKPHPVASIPQIRNGFTPRNEKKWVWLALTKTQALFLPRELILYNCLSSSRVMLKKNL